MNACVYVCSAASSVVYPLLSGDEVVPETYPSATIFFSTIDGFMRYSESSSAHQVHAANVFVSNPSLLTA